MTSDCQWNVTRGGDLGHLGTNAGVQIKRSRMGHIFSTVSFSICKLNGQDSEALDEDGVQDGKRLGPQRTSTRPLAHQHWH